MRVTLTLGLLEIKCYARLKFPLSDQDVVLLANWPICIRFTIDVEIIFLCLSIQTYYWPKSQVYMTQSVQHNKPLNWIRKLWKENTKRSTFTISKNPYLHIRHKKQFKWFSFFLLFITQIDNCCFLYHAHIHFHNRK